MTDRFFMKVIIVLSNRIKRLESKNEQLEDRMKDLYEWKRMIQDLLETK